MGVIHGVSTRVLADRYDITGDLTEATLTINRGIADTTGFGQSAKTAVIGEHEWSLDVKGWYDSGGSVSASGSVQPDGTAGAELALYYLSNLGTAPAVMNKVIGYFPNGLGTAVTGWAGIGGCNGVTRQASARGAVGIASKFMGNKPVTRVTCLWASNVTAAGTGIGVDLGPTPTVQNGAYVYFWLIGTVGGNGTAQVVGTVSVADSLGTTFTDIARFAGTCASAYAIEGTVTAGSVPRYARCAYRTSAAGDDLTAGTASGTLVAAIGYIAPFS